MIPLNFPQLMNIGNGLIGRWKLWGLFAFFMLIASIGTWVTGQYQIGRLDSLKDRYEDPILNYARFYGDSPENSLEQDLLEGCKQAQIGSWLQTTDALRFEGPLTGNRVGVRLDVTKAFVDLNGREMSDCVRDDVEDRQFDIGSMTNTWAIILFLVSACMAAWTWLCRQNLLETGKGRNIYAETLAEASEESIKSEKAQEVSEVVADKNSPAPKETPPDEKS